MKVDSAWQVLREWLATRQCGKALPYRQEYL